MITAHRLRARRTDSADSRRLLPPGTGVTVRCGKWTVAPGWPGIIMAGFGPLTVALYPTRSAHPPGGQCLAELGRQGFIGGLELLPPRVGVASFPPGDVGGEVLDVDLSPGSIGSEQVHGHAPFFQDQDG